MASSKSFLEAVAERRSYYGLTKESTVSDDRIEELVKQTILHTPSAFNVQATRCVVLLKKEHEKLWDITKEILKTVTPPERLDYTLKRITGFHGGYGTILFYEDPAPLKEKATQFAIYADKFPQWSEHTNGMHQYILWTALEAEGMGCNLQHYNPLIDSRIQAEWKVPTEWALKGQLVFGKPEGPPGQPGSGGNKQQQPLEQRYTIHGS